MPELRHDLGHGPDIPETEAITGLAILDRDLGLDALGRGPDSVGPRVLGHALRTAMGLATGHTLAPGPVPGRNGITEHGRHAGLVDLEASPGRTVDRHGTAAAHTCEGLEAHE